MMRTPTSVDHLGTLRPGESALVLALEVSDELYHRLSALGVRVGKRVKVLRRARFAGPLHIRIGTTDLMLRASEARSIRVRPVAA
jgi:ferrous iron transport protein A